MSANPTVRIRVPSNWRTLFGGDLRELECEAATVGDALRWLATAHPELNIRLFSGRTGRLASWINVYLGERNIKDIGGCDLVIDTPAATLTIIQAVAGG